VELLLGPNIDERDLATSDPSQQRFLVDWLQLATFFEKALRCVFELLGPGLGKLPEGEAKAGDLLTREPVDNV
jgi:hypothetical protein